MTARNKEDIQITAAAKAGISERSGRRIENANIPQGDKPMRHWRTRKDHFKGVWENEVVPMLKQNAELQLSGGSSHRYRLNSKAKTKK